MQNSAKLFLLGPVCWLGGPGPTCRSVIFLQLLWAQTQDRSVWMAPINQRCKAHTPSSLQKLLWHPSVLKITPDNVTFITLHYRSKKTFQRLHSVVTQKPISVYVRAKTYQLEKETIQSWKNNFFLYLKFLMHDVEDTPFGLCQWIMSHMKAHEFRLVQYRYRL